MVKIEEIYLKKSFPLIDELRKLHKEAMAIDEISPAYFYLRDGIEKIFMMLERNEFKINVKEVRKHESK